MPRPCPSRTADLPERSLGLLRTESDDQLAPVDAAAHVAVEQKGEPTEHSLLMKPADVAQDVTDAGGDLPRRGPRFVLLFGLDRGRERSRHDAFGILRERTSVRQTKGQFTTMVVRLRVTSPAWRACCSRSNERMRLRCAPAFQVTSTTAHRGG
jgi:hypothetical protein